MQMDVNEIMRHLAHRPPFLLVDRVIECVPGRSIKALKNVTINEPFFQGHFPGYPVMPGVLIIEALAQVSVILVYQTLKRMPDDKSLILFAGIDNARFRQPVEPGDQLIMDVELLRWQFGILKFKGVARVGSNVACEAELMCTMRTIV